MTARDPPAPPADDKPGRDKSVRKPSDPAQSTTPLTPVDRKVGEGPGNLRDRAAAFKRRRGGK